MTYETILTEKQDDLAIITLNRPDRLNAWTPKMGRELADAIQVANDDDDINAMVFTGAGKGFCAGADIKDVFDAQSEGRAEERRSDGDRSTRDWVATLRESKPMVAAINGAAIGVGLTQILPMDFLIATPEAKLSVRFVKMGLVPELASSHFLAARVGFGMASELMLTGKTVLGEEAREIGLIDKVVGENALLSTARETARAMGQNPRDAVRHIKQLLTANAHETDLTLVQKREIKALQECYTSPEHKEAVKAFIDKREPDFKSARQR